MKYVTCPLEQSLCTCAHKQPGVAGTELTHMCTYHTATVTTAEESSSKMHTSTVATKGYGILGPRCANLLAVIL